MAQPLRGRPNNFAAECFSGGECGKISVGVLGTSACHSKSHRSYKLRRALFKDWFGLLSSEKAYSAH
nr:MAG TPA: hypothetical protein [Caudoviricetes sp.]